MTGQILPFPPAPSSPSSVRRQRPTGPVRGVRPVRPVRPVRGDGASIVFLRPRRAGTPHAEELPPCA
jgi:hypothetical protein